MGQDEVTRFKHNRHEGKVLALSVSGNYKKTLKIFEKLFSLKMENFMQI